jgi:sensor histidine kinase regulating citrate/malate metabolism
VRRLFWLALGLGAGAAGAVLTTRFAKKQMQKVAPSTIAREARGGLLELSKLVSESIAEGKRAMREAESEARSFPSEP